MYDHTTTLEDWFFRLGRGSPSRGPGPRTTGQRESSDDEFEDDDEFDDDVPRAREERTGALTYAEGQCGGKPRLVDTQRRRSAGLRQAARPRRPAWPMGQSHARKAAPMAGGSAERQNYDAAHVLREPSRVGI